MFTPTSFVEFGNSYQGTVNTFNRKLLLRFDA